MEDKILKDSEDLSQGSEMLNSNDTPISEEKLSAADLLLKKIAEKRENKEVSEKKEEVLMSEITTQSENNQLNDIPEELEEAEEETSESYDFIEFSREVLAEKLKDLLENPNFNEIKENAERIKMAFYKKLNFEISEAKAKFLSEGNAEENFQYEEDSTAIKFKELLTVYKTKKANWTENTEKNKTKNLAEKYKIIEEIKDLINKPENFDQTFNEFKELQKRWREIGQVPQNEMKNMWDTYNAQIENFYNYININKELRDLDLKKNLEIKIHLCEKAEMLTLEDGIVKAFKQLQELHEQWREAGPVPREKKDEIWERFKSATVVINKKHQDHFDELKNEQETNLVAKQTLCEKAEELAEHIPTNHKEWKESGDKVVELQQLWKAVGYAPKKYNQEIYERFRKACDKFFTAKREYYAEDNEEKNNNLQLKTDLCLQAESHKDSTDWKKDTELYKKLQEDWKKIGSVPSKYSDAIWHRFRKACNAFFEHKESFFKSKDSEEELNLAKKNEIIKKINEFEFTDFNTDDMAKLRDLQNEWTEIGFVPFDQKDKIYKEYRQALDLKFEKLNVDKKGKTENKFKERLAGIKNSGNSKELVVNEVDKLRMKIEKINADINLWENNLGFFANTKNAEVMIKDFKLKIEKSKEYVLDLKNQIKLLLEHEEK